MDQEIVINVYCHNSKNLDHHSQLLKEDNYIIYLLHYLNVLDAIHMVDEMSPHAVSLHKSYCIE
jgi:hypothetical protein